MPTMCRLVCLALILSAPAVWGLQSGPSTGSTSQPGGDDAGGVERKTDFGWFRIAPPEEWPAGAVPSSGMRKALFTLPAPKPEDGQAKAADGELVVFFFGPGSGNVERNLARWKSQFQKRDGVSDEEFAQQSRQKVDGLPVTILEIRGDFLGAHFGGEKPKVKPDWMLLAAIIETEGGAYYLRTLGPRSTLEHWKKAWHTMVLATKAGKSQ